MNRARILFVEINDDGTVGGSHRALLDLVRHLDRRRYAPVVLFYQHHRLLGAFEETGAEVHVWPLAPPRGRPAYALRSFLRRAGGALAVVARCRRFLRAQRIDLVHLNNAPTANFEDWLPAAKSLGRPCVTHARGGESMRPGPVGRFLMRRFDCVIPVSHYMAAAMQQAGVPARLLRTVHDGVDIERVRARVSRDPAAVRAEFGIGAERVLAVMTGHLRAWKGQDVVLEGLRALDPAVRRRLHVLFVGGASSAEDAYLRSLHAAVEAGGLADAVTFAGERSDVPDLMNAADLVLHASTLPEPFGLVVVEAMALGKPVLASRLGGPSEIFVGGDGRLFDPTAPGAPAELAAQLAELVASPDLRAAIGEAARKRVAHFAIGETVRRIEALYAELLPPERSPAGPQDDPE